MSHMTILKTIQKQELEHSLARVTFTYCQSLLNHFIEKQVRLQNTNIFIFILSEILSNDVLRNANVEATEGSEHH